MNRRRFLAACSTAVLVRVPFAAAASYPSQAVKVVVPFAPGGTTDVLARLVSDQMRKRFDQPFIVENRPGAAGNVGTAAVAKSPADGYTLLLGGIGPNAVNPSLFPNIPYDPVKDFTAIALLGIGSNVLVAGPGVPANIADVKSFVAWAKAQGVKLSYASPGQGTSNHIASEVFRRQAGFEAVAVNYRGAAPALNDVIAGHLPFMFNNLEVALPQIAGGTVRALAVTSPKRLTNLPNVATFVEQGYPNLDVSPWFGLFGPPGLPKSIVDVLHDAAVAGMAAAEVVEKLTPFGMVTRPATPVEFADFVAREVERWAKTIKELGITAT
jgi:tripartite-type tricarboxylate transporter receptor subunit TctC